MGKHARKVAQDMQPVPVKVKQTAMHVQHANRTHRRHKGPGRFTWKNLTVPHKHIACLPQKSQNKIKVQVTSFLAAAPPVHIAAPGAGATQTLADNGMSTAAVVNGEEVMMKAFKDGFSLTGCYMDGMPKFYDKFGNNKDQYKGQMANVSVVVYTEAVLKGEQKPM